MGRFEIKYCFCQNYKVKIIIEKLNHFIEKFIMVYAVFKIAFGDFFKAQT